MWKNLLSKTPRLFNWVDRNALLMKPDSIHVCSGSPSETQLLYSQMTNSGTIIPLANRPGSYYARSHVGDVARVEERTLICSKKESDAGPLNNWRNPYHMKSDFNKLYQDCMRGRQMFVVPFSMGPLGSPFSITGIQITDSPFVVANMNIMTRMGQNVLDSLGEDDPWVPCLHSVGAPLTDEQSDVPWPCNPQKWIAHFPDSLLVLEKV